MPKQPAKPSKPRQKTRVWREGPGDFRFEITHPDGHHATGANLKTKKQAETAAAAVKFAPRSDDDQVIDQEPTADES